MALKGKFKPQYPKKYKGDPTKIIYRSSWELKLMSYLDQHNEIEQWASEEIFIPYRSPLDNKIHRYFPDFWIKKTNGEQILIEVKPKHETLPPTNPGNKSKRTFLKEVITYGINQSKWQSARGYCAERGWDFQVMTESELGIK